MRDTLTFRATAAAMRVWADIGASSLGIVDVFEYTKNQTRVRELQDALLKFQLPYAIKMYEYDMETLTKNGTVVTRPLHYREGTEFPIQGLSTLLDTVSIVDVNLNAFLTDAAVEIEEIAKQNYEIILSVERSEDMKSTKLFALLVLARLSEECQQKIRIMETMYIPVGETRQVVVVDDMSYSGTQLYDDHEPFKNVTFLLVRCTDEARTKLGSHEHWTVKTHIPSSIPVVRSFGNAIISDVIQYVDMGAPDATGAGALMFAPWKIPDSLSTFDRFWKGYVYIGNLITNPLDFGEEMIDSDLLWIPIEWGGGRNDVFDATAPRASTSIFDGSECPFYKISPTVASLWDQVFNAHNAAILDEIVAAPDGTILPSTTETVAEPPPKRAKLSTSAPEHVNEIRKLFKGDSVYYRLFTTPDRVQMVCHGINDERRVVAQWVPTTPQHVVVSVRRLRFLYGYDFIDDVTEIDVSTPTDDNKLMDEFEEAIMKLNGARPITCIYRSTDNVLKTYGYEPFRDVTGVWVKILGA